MYYFKKIYNGIYVAKALDHLKSPTTLYHHQPHSVSYRNRSIIWEWELNNYCQNSHEINYFFHRFPRR